VSSLAAAAFWLTAVSSAAQPVAPPAGQQPAPPPTASSPVAPTRVAPPATQRPAAGVDPERLARVDEIVEAAIEAGSMPGAVALAGHRGRIVYRKAFGQRAVAPAAEPMTLDTIFDAASLTKVVATTTAVMMLVEEGRLRLTDRVSAHVPDFGRYGKDAITVRHLLTHTSGLRPDLDLKYPWNGYNTAIQLAVEEVPVAGPDERVIYSDINFFLLGDIVARVSGMPLERFTAERIFKPLGMRDSGFLPAEALRAAFAPLLSGRPAGEVVHQCGSGVTACHNLFAMELAGLAGSRLYPGSWSEWCADPARPVETGDAPPAR